MIRLPAAEIIDFAGHYFGRFSYPLIFLGGLMENIAVINYFTPGSTIVWIAGFYARLGIFNPILVWLTAATGAIIGNQIDYLLGYTGVYHLIRALKIEKRVEEQKKRYVRCGNIVEAFILYFAGYLRSFLLIALGALRIPWPNYLAFTAAGAFVRKGTFVAVGYFLGSNRPLIEGFFSNFWWMGTALLILWLLMKNTFLKYGRRFLDKIRGREFLRGKDHPTHLHRHNRRRHLCYRPKDYREINGDL